jgi:alpha-beta hydrolase superfamily lysophospholipase
MFLTINPVKFCIIAVAGVIFSACSPHVNHPGQQVMQPKLEREFFRAADGAKLPVRSWLPEKQPFKAIIVAVHGFNDYSNSFTLPGNYLRQYGIACYAYDQRGFGAASGRGLWAGEEAYTSDLSSVVKEVRKEHPDVPLYVMGESMGGAVTIVTMTGQNPPDVDGVILIAPAVWGRQTMPWYQRWLLAITAHTVPWLELTGKGLKVIATDNIEVRRAISRDPLFIKATRIDSIFGLTNLMDEALSSAEKLHLPALVQYGKKDQIIPKDPTLLMLGKMPKTTRKAFYADGYHMLLRDLQREKPLSDIVAWIMDHNALLVNGESYWQ